MNKMPRTKITDLDKTIAVIEQKIDDGFKQNSKEHSEVFALIDKIDSKKADKEVVDTIKSDIRRVVWIVIGAVITAILGLIVKTNI